MGETAEDMQVMLDTLGAWLTFDNFSMQAISDIHITMLFQGNAVVNGTQDRNFIFITTSALCFANSVDTGLNFTIEDNTYRYYLSVASRPMDLLDGWCEFMADFIRRENV